jgi:hypothetical protein
LAGVERANWKNVGLVAVASLWLLALIATALAQQASGHMTPPLVRVFLSKEPDILWRKNLALAFLNNCGELAGKEN